MLRVLHLTIAILAIATLHLQLSAVSGSEIPALTRQQFEEMLAGKHNNNLRGQSSGQGFKSFRQLNTPEAVALRKEILAIEERIERSQTGLNTHPNHKVPYENHPWNSERRYRRLQDNGDGNTQEVSNGELFKPMRIKFETKALDDTRDSNNAAKIDFLKNEVLPRAGAFWTRSLSVVPVSGRLRMSTGELNNREFCGDYEFSRVPSNHISTGVEDADLVLYVSGTPSSRFCAFQTLAVAVACNFDQYDRPTAGAINVCLSTINVRSDGTASAAVIQDNVDVLIHEIAHVLGHSSNSYRFFRDPDTGEPLTPRPFSTRTVTCVDGQSRSLILPADNTMKFFQASNGQRYASIVTPKVRAIVRNQFDCQSLEGCVQEFAFS